MKNYKWVAAGFASFLMTSSAAFAADAAAGILPAVSSVNGKIELATGWGNLDGFASTWAFKGGASISVPLGERFGLQFDVADVNAFNDNMIGATTHFFTRNPDSYLFGVIGGAAWTNKANFQYVGPEVELYMNNVSIEATAGYLNLNAAGVASNQFYAIGDLAFYATDNMRFSIGGRSIAGFESGHVGAEYALSDQGLPLSLTADGSIGENGFSTANVGLKLYFGGDNKSLIRRHREDDPRNRSLDIFNGAGSAFNSNVPTKPIKCLFANPVGANQAIVPCGVLN
ncbi:MAG: hypothetical protein KGO94_08115 [Alphaproteobacteria bacterium]|nr:hypothetical protein [Alphaproteobacteria bacterium]